MPRGHTLVTHSPTPITRNYYTYYYYYYFYYYYNCYNNNNHYYYHYQCKCNSSPKCQIFAGCVITIYAHKLTFLNCR